MLLCSSFDGEDVEVPSPSLRSISRCTDAANVRLPRCVRVVSSRKAGVYGFREVGDVGRSPVFSSVGLLVVLSIIVVVMSCDVSS